MRSSISSFEVARLVVLVAGPTALIALVLVGAAELWWRADPCVAADDIEGVVVEEQLVRARAAPPADVLILGDSSALMDVDPKYLGELLNARVESLATVAFVGPTGWARMLELYATVHRAPTILLLVHGIALNIEESTYVRRGLERWTLVDEPPRLQTPQGARRQIWCELLAPALGVPLPGRYGVSYGTAKALRARVREHGSLVDPNPPPPAVETPYRYEISSAFSARLPRLAEVVHKAAPERALLVLTPLPSDHSDAETQRSRLEAARTVSTALGLDYLDVKPTMNPVDHATVTHLTAKGRQRYTEHLAAALRP